MGLKKHGQSQRDTSGYQGPKTHLSYPGDADIDTKKTLALSFSKSNPFCPAFLPVFAKEENKKHKSEHISKK